MHRHDLDLIAEYAEGTLQDDTAAGNLVRTCDVCRAEYAAQKSVLAGLAGMESLAMTDHEKAILHRDLWTELRRPETASVTGRRLWAKWVAGAAAALLLSVGLVGVLNQLGGSNGVAETFSEIGAALDDGVSSESMEETTLAPTSGVVGAPSEGLGYFYDSTTDFSAIAQKVLDDPNRTTDDYRFSSAEDECLENTGLVGFSLVFDAQNLTRLLIAVADNPEEETPVVAFIDPETCKVVHLEE